ncbi:MAG: UDP-3-O-acyl-N-acetylglucosamine deacetylase [Thermodesulfobacteriota bacterium]
MKGFLKKIHPHQHTLSKEISFSGIGLHSGLPIAMKIKPAKPDTGIRFFRTDLQQEIPAMMDRVVDTTLATTIGANGASVSTTEHLLAALAGLGIDNALVELNGPEVPIMDGSSAPFVHIIKRIERKRQDVCRKLLKITKEISFQAGDTMIRLLPYDGYKVTCEIDFDHQLIRKQKYTVDVNSKRFIKEISAARTFGFMDQIEELRANGLALGGSLANAVVIDQTKVLNIEGLRFSDEFVRHKVLDLIGDLALLGCQIIGRVVASKSGHGHHLGLMKEIVAHPECWEFVTLEKNEKEGVLAKVVSSTKEAGNLILPFLVPSNPVATAPSLRGS